VGGTLLLALAALVPLATLLPPLSPLAAAPGPAAWFVLGAAGWTGSGLLDYVFIAQRRADLMFRRNAVASAVKLALLAAAAALHATGAATVLATWSLSGLVGTGHGLLICHRRIHRLGRVSWSAARRELALLAGPSLGHHAISVGGLIPTYLLPVVVTARLGTADNAYFYVTWMVGSAIFMISPAVSSAIFAEGSHDSARLSALSRKSLRIILAVVAPSAAVIAAAGGFILGLFGQRYASIGYGLLVLLLLSSVPDAVANVAVATLRVRRRLAAAAALNGVMAVIAVGGAWIATPRLGIAGAGLAWLGAQTAGAVVVGTVGRRLGPSHTTEPAVVPPASTLPAAAAVPAAAITSEGCR
jgi:O-antigen/teichoic acid export membrane protein